MCEGGQKLRQRCVRVDSEDGLQRGFNHLAFDSHALAHADVASRVYVHVTHTLPDAEGGDGLIYVDYWWYLPDNPAHSGSRRVCGPGFSIGGVTCFDHQSDWEGVTVVLRARDPPAVAVNYAQHDGSVRYTWPALQRLWELTGARRFAPAGDLDARPLVFSARGHARVLPDRLRHGVLPAERGPDAAEHGRPAGQPRTTVAARGRAPPTRAARGSASPSSPPAATAPSPTAGTTGREPGAPPTASRASSAPRPSRRGPPASTIAIGSHRARTPRSSSATAGSRPSETRPAPPRSSRPAGPPAAVCSPSATRTPPARGQASTSPGPTAGTTAATGRATRGRRSWPISAASASSPRSRAAARR